ncbi:serine hydrolase domain-containing protein [Neobacillus drentensis]|uniref:serine hydrolase domain-containing protein n=1 Tax=Neobacillus drentensis TaxID=220684 RepID=UPI002FFEE15A
MKKMIIFVLCFWFSIIPVVTGQAAVNDEVDKMKQIDQYVRTEMKVAHIPGLSLGVVKGDQIVHLKSFGEKGTISPQTPFILGSSSKAFTAMAVMKLVEEGKVVLETSIQKYLPELEVPAQITVENLLNQTSGISGAPKKGGNTLTVNQNHIGTVFEYSNENYKLLGEIIEAVTNRPYQEFIREKIFLPLQMEHSFTSQTKAEQDGLVKGYRTWFGINVSNKLPFNEDYLPAGYLISSAEDMTHFLIAQMNNGSYLNQTVVSKSSIDRMHQASVKAPIMGKDSFYGMGWFQSPIDGLPSIRHSGEVPNYHSTMIIMPNEKYGIVLLANINNSLIISAMIEKIAEGVVSILAAKEPSHISPTSYYQTYLIMDAVVLIIVAMLYFHMKNIKKWQVGVSSGKFGMLKKWIFPLVVNNIFPILLLTQFPQLLGFTWSFLFDFVPDATSVVIGISVILLLVGCVKVYIVLVVLNKRREKSFTLKEIPQK